MATARRSCTPDPVFGRGWLVQATGPRSELGRIGQALRTIATEPPGCRPRPGNWSASRGVRHWRERAGHRALRPCAWRLAGRAGRHRARDVDARGVSAGSLTAFMVMGAWRLSRARVLTRRGGDRDALQPRPVPTDRYSDESHDGRRASLAGGGVAALGNWRCPRWLAHLLEIAMLASAPQP